VIFSALYDAAREAHAGPSPWLGRVYFGLLVIGGLNTAISAFYYVRVLKVMVIEKPAETTGSPRRISFAAVNYVTLMAIVVVILGIMWNFLVQASDKSVASLAPSPAKVAAAPGGGH